MGSTIFIVWRESMEAMLVIGILYTWLKNQSLVNAPGSASESKKGMHFLWGGVLSGIALAAIAVGREGAETVIFLYGAGLGQNNSLVPFTLSALGGFVLAFLTFFALSQGTRYFSWQVFFRFSEIILLFLAAALLVDGVDHMIGLGWIPALVDPLWDSTFLLDDSSQFGGVFSAFTGYRAHPALMLLIIYSLYWVSIILLLRTPKAPKVVKK
ncbi:MAG: FTR1 family protein [Pseudomonadota bacterium]